MLSRIGDDNFAEFGGAQNEMRVVEQRRDHRAEARSTVHLCTHKPRNPYCEACVRAKMRQKRRYKGSFVNVATFWGHRVTGDHITSQKERMLGITGDKDALVLRDQVTENIVGVV